MMWSLAKRFAERVIGMHDGRIVFDGPATSDLNDSEMLREYLWR